MEYQSFMQTRNQSQFQEKIQRKMERNKIDALILTTPESIFYATGFYSWSYHGRACGNVIAVMPTSGRATIICSQFEQGGAELQTKGDVDVVAYPVAMYIEDYFDPSESSKICQPDPNSNLSMACEIIKLGKEGNLKIGVERNALPYDKYLYFIECYGEENLVDIGAILTDLKLIKLPWEIDVLRYSAQVAEKMMNITMRSTQVGMTEADIFKIWHQAAYDVTGGHELCHVNQVHTTGPDFWATLLPRETKLSEGDIIRLDGGVSIYGYISDLGRSYAVGKLVDPKRQAIFDTLLKGYETARSMLGPGIKLGDIFKETMGVCRKGALPDFVRGHFGHSISLGPSPDFPMISANNETTLQPGMVFCVELPYYSSENGSYNLEDTFVITENGYEAFTNTNRSLFV